MVTWMMEFGSGKVRSHLIVLLYSLCPCIPEGSSLVLPWREGGSLPLSLPHAQNCIPSSQRLHLCHPARTMLH